MRTDTAAFIANEYRPAGVVIQDPRNMHLDDIRKVLQHCYRLQVKSGPESAFRFALFIGPKRNRLFANYPETTNAGGEKRFKPSAGKKSKGKQRADILQGLIRIDQSVEPPTGMDLQHAPNPNDEDAPMQPDVADPEQNQIDPLLLGQDSEQIGQQINHSPMTQDVYEPPPIDLVEEPPIRNASPTRSLQDVYEPPPIDLVEEPPNARPTRSLHDSAGSVTKTTGTRNKRANKKVGKKAKANLPPETMMRTDDLAALEAQKMMQSGSKRRSKPTRRK